jgi:hypothetical protein
MAKVRDESAQRWVTAFASISTPWANMGQAAPAILAFSAAPATKNLQVTHSKIQYRVRISPSPPYLQNRVF